MKWDPVSRRHFLQGLGGFTLALPFLPSLVSAAEIPARRLIGFGCSFGIYPEFWPTMTTKDLGPGVWGANLSGITGDLSMVFNNANFSDLKSKILLLRGLDTCFYSNHNASTVFAAGVASNGPSAGGLTNVSVDWLLSQSKIIYPMVPKLRNLILSPNPKPTGTSSSNTYTFAKTSTGFTSVSSITDAQVAYDLAFGGTTTSTTASATVPGPADTKKAVDKVFSDYQKLKSSSRLSAADKLRLEDHMTHLSELQGQLATAGATSTVTCTKPTPRAPTSTTPTLSDWDLTMKNNIDILVAALACGNTKIGSIIFNGAFFTAHLGSSDYHQAVSHSRSNLTGFLKVHQPMAKYVAYLIRKLDSITEADGKSLLYHSIVLWNNSLSAGDKHSSYELPIFMAGNGGGTILPGRILDYRLRPLFKGDGTKGSYLGRPYNQLFVSILQAMGLQPADYEQNGVPGFGTYDHAQWVNPTVAKHHAPFKTVDVKRAALPRLSG